jgi:hypothetical protein
MGVIFSFLGGLFGIKSPVEEMKTNMAEMMRKNTDIMMKRQAELMMKQRQLMMAHQFAMGKDRFMFYKYFYYTCVFGLSMNALKMRNPHVLGPLVPLTFAFAYQWDFYVGNKLKRIRKDAEHLLETQPELFYPAMNNAIISEEEYKAHVSGPLKGYTLTN